MKIQFRIINKGKGNVIIMPSDLHKVCSCCEENSRSKNTVITSAELLVFKADGNLNNDVIEPRDTVIGNIEGQFLNSGTFYGGDPLLLNSYQTAQDNKVGVIKSFANGLLSYDLRQEILDQFIPFDPRNPFNSGFLGINAVILAPDGDGGYLPEFEMTLSEPNGEFLQLGDKNIVKLRDTSGEFSDSDPFTVNFLDIISSNSFDIKRLIDGELFIYSKRDFNPQGNYNMEQRNDEGINVGVKYFNEQNNLIAIGQDEESGEGIWQLQMAPPFYGYYVIVDIDTNQEISNRFTIPQ
ncbi:hypothetical protein DNC80_15475 [Flavobacterium sp. SOK18b]|uniref:hypothetical protein n=2 Tax=Flavobacterium sp. SOK18b TaxID=797900 RepID=UPI0015FBF03D|nr:hypothetical protein [Flavobacterium sp. SOK18b]MBB1195065.1 hypothetical protein [Flavobacterium sp. SOK18b]